MIIRYCLASSSGQFHLYWLYIICFVYHSLYVCSPHQHPEELGKVTPNNSENNAHGWCRSLKHNISFILTTLYPHLFGGSLTILRFSAMLEPSHTVACARDVTLDIVRVRGRYRVGKQLGSGAFGAFVIRPRRM
jgi:hypothetical protein